MLNEESVYTLLVGVTFLHEKVLLYAMKVKDLKQTKPSQWWNAVKKISGKTPASGTDSLLKSLQVEGYDHLSEREIANRINNA